MLNSWKFAEGGCSVGPLEIKIYESPFPLFSPQQGFHPLENHCLESIPEKQRKFKNIFIFFSMVLKIPKFVNIYFY